jgi:hypothetical protein
MASTKIPKNGGLFIAFFIKMIKGVTNLGAGVPVTMVTATDMEAKLDLFTEKNNAFNTARSARLAASEAFQASMAAVAVWLQASRNALVPKLGNRWNTAWAQAGFINTSTAVPVKTEARIALIAALRDFFTAQPSYEAPSLDVTAAQATSLYDAAVGAQQLLATKAMGLKTAGDDWILAYNPAAALAQRLIKNLEGRLGKLDPRWLGFGLNMPGMIQTPGQPQNVTAHLDETGAIIVQWDALPLATRFRVRGMLIGVETAYSLVARSTDTMAAITDILPGQTMQIIVQGVNENLQGVASEPILFTVPPLAKAERAATPTVEPLAATNGGNGHTNGSRLPAMA